MNLLDYTKKLSEKIKLYDSLAIPKNFVGINPFAKPINFTIIWIDENKSSE